MQVVGICLFQNEDIYLRQVLENVAAFCDKMILLNNKSTDGSLEIVEEICQKYSHFELHHIASPSESHAFVEEYANTDTWIFGVDGDEIYDPVGLAVLRPKLSTDYCGYWNIYGNVIHAKEIDLKGKTVLGFQSPPCRSMTKIYNFSKIISWKNCDEERLHGGNLIFKEGYQKKSLELQHQSNWENSIFRCIHAVFEKRSTVCSSEAYKPNIYDINRYSFRQKMLRFLLGIKQKSGRIGSYDRGDIIYKKVEWIRTNDH